MFKRILFPADSSDNTKRAFVYVVDTAIKYDSEVFILHTYEVVEEIVNILGDFDPALHKVEEKLIEQSMSIVNPFKEELQRNGIKTESLFVRGDVEYEIVKISKDQNIDLIIMGSRDKISITSFLIGRISNYVIHHAKCPTLVVH